MLYSPGVPLSNVFGLSGTQQEIRSEISSVLCEFQENIVTVLCAIFENVALVPGEFSVSSW